jgi:hypothetical protein
MSEPTDTETWVSNWMYAEVRGVFRVLAGVIAVLSALATIVFIWASFAESYAWFPALLVLIPGTVLMALVAARGSVARRPESTSTASTDATPPR